ncbi:MAG TPA: alpha-E domain-containing protein, partial [Cyclobacteriaceae bacterium]|nr:alpha-E domain-containing protein [Cyclobacteriaceae bacterium]
SSYRSVYRTSLDVSPTIDLLFLNSHNPTSIFSQLEGLLKYARSLATKDGGTNDNEISRLVFESYSQVRLMNIAELTAVDPSTRHRKAFDDFCSRLEKQIQNISAKLGASYFSHSRYQQQGSRDGFQFEV